MKNDKVFLRVVLLLTIATMMRCGSSDDVRVSAASPNTGTASGGTLVTLTGEHFEDSTDFTIGGVSCVAPTKISDTKMTCITGAYPTSSDVTVDITATNPDATKSTLKDGFTYTP